MVLNFKHDPMEAIEGVLWAYRGGWFTLKDAVGFRAGETRPMPGDQVVHRSAISYLTVVP